MLLGIPVYHHVNLLDVTGPLEMFFWAKEVGKAHLDTVILSEDGGPVTSINGVRFHAQASFADKPKLDVLWVPGAGDKVIGSMLRDPHSRYLNYLRQVAEDAKWVCSVCEGALLLARAGLLDSHRATTHWSVMKCLERFPNVHVDASNPRFVVSGNRLTGGGVSSGLDEALKLISLLFGREAAEAAQVTTQYFPEPPVHGKIPPQPPCAIDIP